MTNSAALNSPLYNHPRSADTRQWGNLSGSARGALCADIARQSAAPVLLVCPDSAAAWRAREELRFYAADLPVDLFPDWETLPYDNFSPHQDLISDRLRILSALGDARRSVLIVSANTLMQRLPPAEFIRSRSFSLRRGQQFDAHQTRLQLVQCGYRQVDTVYEHGEYASRGSLIDIFAMGSKRPFRIDLIDDEIDSLRSFDPETQRSIDDVVSIELLPGREFPLDKDAIAAFRRRWHERFDTDPRKSTVYTDISDGIAPAGIEYYLPLFFDRSATLFDYLPADSVVITTEGIEAACHRFWQDASGRYEQRAIDKERPLLKPAEILLSTDEIFAAIKRFDRHSFSATGAGSGDSRHDAKCLPPPDLTVDAKAAQPLAPLKHYIESRSAVLICAESAGRREALLDLCRRHALAIEVCSGWQAFCAAGPGTYLTVAPLPTGLDLPAAGLGVVVEAQLFGARVAQRRRRTQRQTQAEFAIRNLAELVPGAPVVHIDHGVGRYIGLERLDVGDEPAEFLCLEYADDAKLYVPVSSLERVSRYGGTDPERAPLNKLGNEQWQKARRKAAEKVRDVAAELLEIYARRAAREGVALTASDDYHRFAESFPFEETPDQLTAIEAVIADMARPQPMDRLICGDVGFGKTEVAMRAAFIAVDNSKQVAVLVPTTLLAQQHYESFRDRFADWPVTVEVLSRFRSAAERADVVARANAGKVDILIGTHQLLNGEIKYPDLGLLVIDEEHRFGVRQKDQLKSLRASVDILTLTATPIPRTLNMSMAGIRDLSIIATPPARRLSVNTFVRQRDEALIREAALREMMRGGQIYYLHNEVKTIDKAAADLAALIPEARIAIAHGQMAESRLERVMADFYHGRFNVLLCSTIIETGIDVPNANTIIIERADKFGLAQLHQLRGRVGRSHHQAYAYLLTPQDRTLTKDAEKRLLAISEAGDLGAGFTLATNDMEIRGAGELLGDEQSGQIENVGFTLYSEMLDEAVSALREGRMPDPEGALARGVEINLGVPALLPDDYLPDIQARLMLYKRIASCEDDSQLHDLQIEMIDRFGLLPEPAKALMRLSAIKLQLKTLGIDKIDVAAKGAKIQFADATTADPLALVKLVQSDPQRWRLEGANALRFTQALDLAETRFEFAEQLVSLLTPA